eukprot:756621-Hanusia_phi.AAC.1
MGEGGRCRRVDQGRAGDASPTPDKGHRFTFVGRCMKRSSLERLWLARERRAVLQQKADIVLLPDSLLGHAMAVVTSDRTFDSWSSSLGFRLDAVLRLVYYRCDDLDHQM